MTKTADEILSLRKPNLTPPKYAKRLAEAARQGGDELAKVAKKYNSQFNKMGSAAGTEFSMRPVAKRLLTDLKKAKPADIDKVVKQFMEDKAKRHARMIARSEAIESYRESYRRSTEDQEWVKGYRWELGANHPRPDECDILAGQNNYGLGPGGYPVDAVPDTPHPNDMCVQVAIIDTDHFKREKAERNNEKPPPEPWKKGKPETSEQWLKKQPPSVQKQILGPTKYARFKKAPGDVLGKDGIPKRVKDLPRAGLAKKGTGAPPKPAEPRIHKTGRKPPPPKGTGPKVTLQRGEQSPRPIPELTKSYKGPLKSEMSLRQAEKSIRKLPDEHMMAWDVNGRPLARTSGSAGNVPVPPEMRGHVGTITHNHPPDLMGQASPGAPMAKRHYTALSPEDVVMAHHLKVQGQIRAVTPDGHGMSLVVTDRAAWTAKETIDSGIWLETKVAYGEANRTAMETAAKITDHVERNRVWSEVYAKETKRLYNEIGKTYGFEIRTINPR
jgi:hypothetical protein